MTPLPIDPSLPQIVEELRASKRVSVFRDFVLRKMAEQQVW